MTCIRHLLTILALLVGLGLGSAAAADAAAPVPAAATPPAAAAEVMTATETVVEEDGWLMSNFKKGGPVMYPLALTSIIALCFILERLVNVFTGIAPAGLVAQVDAAWKAGDHARAKQIAEKNGSALGQVLAYCAEHKDASVEQINEATGEIASRELRRHHQNNYWLAIVSTLAPLLGLLGTITGMIASFDVVATAGDIANIGLVAGGISEALITTAAGLIIAIPALGAFHLFKVITNVQALRLEQRATAAALAL